MARFVIFNIQEPYYQNRDDLYSPIKGNRYKTLFRNYSYLIIYIILLLTSEVYFPLFNQLYRKFVIKTKA